MLVSNEDFMPNKPSNQNLINQMKKKISTRELSTPEKSKSRLSSNNPRTDLINASLPVNFQASTQPQLVKSSYYQDSYSVRSLSKMLKNEKDEASFRSNEKGKNSNDRNLTAFDKDDLPNIQEFSHSNTENTDKLSGKSDERYNANKVYKKKLRANKDPPKNIVFKEYSSSGMDGVKSLSSGYTDSSDFNKEDNEDFAQYVVGFICGFFLSIFGVIIMLFCSKKRRRCEGATHGMIVSGIILIVVFNGYFLTVMQDFAKGKIEKDHHILGEGFDDDSHLVKGGNFADFDQRSKEMYREHVFNGKVSDLNGEEVDEMKEKNTILLM